MSRLTALASLSFVLFSSFWMARPTYNTYTPSYNSYNYTSGIIRGDSPRINYPTNFPMRSCAPRCGHPTCDAYGNPIMYFMDPCLQPRR